MRYAKSVVSIIGFLLAISSQCRAQTPPGGESAPTIDAIGQACTPILTHALSSRSYLEQYKDIRDNVVYDLCTSHSSTEDDASKEGFELGAVIYGVPVRALFSNDKTVKKEAHDKLCSHLDDHFHQTDKTILLNEAIPTRRRNITRAFHSSQKAINNYFVV